MKVARRQGKELGLYYKPMTIVNDDSRVVTKLETSLTDDARAVIYNCHMFIVQATDFFLLFECCIQVFQKNSSHIRK
jgi:hypothetical protein